jgi:hypothetical protein
VRLFLAVLISSLIERRNDMKKASFPDIRGGGLKNSPVSPIAKGGKDVSFPLLRQNATVVDKNMSRHIRRGFGG